MRGGHSRRDVSPGVGVALAVAMLVGPPLYFYQTSGSLVYSAIGTALFMATYAVAGALMKA